MMRASSPDYKVLVSTALMGNYRMAFAVQAGAPLLLATEDAIQKSSGQIEGEDPGEHFPPHFHTLILPPCPSVLCTKAAPLPSA